MLCVHDVQVFGVNDPGQQTIPKTFTVPLVTEAEKQTQKGSSRILQMDFGSSLLKGSTSNQI